MKKIKFEYAGLRHENEVVFLTSKHRRITREITHRNKYHCELSIPSDFLKIHFKYCRRTGVYITSLKMGDILEFLTVYDMDKKEYIHTKIYSDYYNGVKFTSGLKK